MKSAIFVNITDKPFVGYWNGKARTFASGGKYPMPEWAAAHFAKHLTNQILIESGDDSKIRSTSPKKPDEMPLYKDIFDKCCIVEGEEEKDELDVQMEIMQQQDNEKVVTKEEKKKAGRPKKVIEAKEPEENEFEDLK